MEWFQVCHRFDLHYNQPVHHFIHTVTGFQFHAFIFQCQGHFGLNRDIPQAKFMLKAGLISRFQQAWPQVLMDLNSCSNDLF